MIKNQSLRNLPAWFGERFPLPHFILGFCVSLKIGATMEYFNSSSNSNFSIQLGFSSLAVVGFFLLLRVLDEHKDFEKDLQNHPDRVLQRGLVGLNELKLVGFLSVLLITAYTLTWGDPGRQAVALMILALVWTFLMTFEFFCRAYITKRPLLYGVSHLFVVVLIGLWVARTFSTGPQWYAALVVSTHLLLVSAALEVTRKSFTVEENDKEGDSYSRTMGLKPAVGLAIALIVSATLLDVISIGLVGSYWYSGIPLGLATIQVVLLNHYGRNQDANKRKKAEMFIGIQYILSSMITYLST